MNTHMIITFYTLDDETINRYEKLYGPCRSFWTAIVAGKQATIMTWKMHELELQHKLKDNWGGYKDLKQLVL